MNDSGNDVTLKHTGFLFPLKPDIPGPVGGNMTMALRQSLSDGPLIFGSGATTVLTVFGTGFWKTQSAEGKGSPMVHRLICLFVQATGKHWADPGRTVSVSGGTGTRGAADGSIILEFDGKAMLTLNTAGCLVDGQPAEGKALYDGLVAWCEAAFNVKGLLTP